jgi:hypothetical protein
MLSYTWRLDLSDPGSLKFSQPDESIFAIDINRRNKLDWFSSREIQRGVPSEIHSHCENALAGSKGGEIT